MKTILKMIAVLGAASLAFGTVCFDYASGDPGAGTFTTDGSWFQLHSSAVVEAQHEGVWYPLGQGLADYNEKSGKNLPCPGSENVEDCYYGWNDGDMDTPEGKAARVTLSEYVNPEEWGYVNGGFVYILDGAQMASANFVNIGDNITIVAKVAAGKPAKLYVYDANYDPNNGETGIMKANVSGNGSMQTLSFTKSQFTTWASNVYDPTRVKAIMLEYEIGAAAKGAPFPGQLQEMMVWQKLEVSGSCTAGGSIAIGDKVASKAVGFAALRGGLQFSNIPAGTVLNVQLFNTLGKVVANHKVSSKNSFVSTEGLNNGVYVVRATDGAKLNMMRNVTVMK